MRHGAYSAGSRRDIGRDENFARGRVTSGGFVLRDMLRRFALVDAGVKDHLDVNHRQCYDNRAKESQVIAGGLRSA